MVFGERYPVDGHHMATGPGGPHPSASMVLSPGQQNWVCANIFCRTFNRSPPGEIHTLQLDVPQLESGSIQGLSSPGYHVITFTWLPCYNHVLTMCISKSRGLHPGLVWNRLPLRHGSQAAFRTPRKESVRFHPSGQGQHSPVLPSVHRKSVRSGSKSLHFQALKPLYN